MTLEQKITEFLEANAIKKDSDDYRRLYNDFITGEGLPEELLKERFVFTHEGQRYYFMNPKLAKLHRELSTEIK